MQHYKPTTAAPDTDDRLEAEPIDGPEPTRHDLQKMLQGEGNRKQRRRNAAHGMKAYRKHLQRRSRTSANDG